MFELDGLRKEFNKINKGVSQLKIVSLILFSKNQFFFNSEILAELCVFFDKSGGDATKMI
ncbi:hypothetical protein ZOSMA_839G00010 [Zostera marina]|uniref:Uncharacterized protein n=1 Tax=Zostera marina TaxID=29655 RepID=A0A0K9NM63_ZOSMR|nr:hypothetical protein ZOSMA_839G00010 [Zostera marina]